MRECIVAMNLLPNGTTQARAFRVSRERGFAEKRGSMINKTGRLQRLNRAVEPPGSARDDWEILRDLIQGISGANGIYTIEDVFKQMAAAIPAVDGLSLGQNRRPGRGPAARPGGTHDASRRGLAHRQDAGFLAHGFPFLHRLVPDPDLARQDGGACSSIVLTMVSYTVYAERRVSALIQDRIGPNRVGLSPHAAGRKEGFLAVPGRPRPADRGCGEAPHQGGFHPRARQ